MKRVFRLTAGCALLLATLPRPAAAQALTLAAAADSALAAHPSLGSARARHEAALHARDIARAARLPSASFGATVTRFEEPMVVAPLHSFDPRRPPTFDDALVQGQVVVDYTLFDSGVRSSRTDGADAQAEAAVFGLAAAEMDLLAEVARRYLAVLSARAVQTAALAQLNAMEEEFARAQERLDAGTAPELEVLRAEASLQDARVEETAALRRVGLTERALARTMGGTPGALEGVSLADVVPRSGELIDGTRTNPIVEAARQTIRGAEAQLREERAGRMPRLDLRAALQDFGTVSGGHVTEWQAGIRLSWPVFTGGVRGASIRRADAQLRAAESEMATILLAVDAETDAAESGVLEADERAAALESSIAQWEEVARIEALALEAGAGVQSDLLRAQAGLFRARAGHAQARYDAVLARVELARAQGVLSREWLNRSLEMRR